MIEASHSCIPKSGGGSRSKVDSTKNCPVTTAVPGWKDQVRQFRSDSLFWHSVWLSAGRPTVGVLYEIMKKTRNSYHYAVRKVKKKADLIRAEKLLESSLSGDVDLTV